MPAPHMLMVRAFCMKSHGLTQRDARFARRAYGTSTGIPSEKSTPAGPVLEDAFCDHQIINFQISKQNC